VIPVTLRTGAVGYFLGGVHRGLTTAIAHRAAGARAKPLRKTCRSGAY
jgi:hypothetical protein